MAENGMSLRKQADAPCRREEEGEGGEMREGDGRSGEGMVSMRERRKRVG